jgi:CHAD domain-containing protein
MERLHRLRIRIRRARQFTDLAVALDPRHERAFSSSWARLQKDLGDLHDLDLVLAGLDDEVRETAWAAELRRERRQLRREVLKALQSPVQIPGIVRPPRPKTR